MAKSPETMGDKLRAMASRVDAMNKEMAKLEEMSACYSMMVVSLQRVTTQLSDVYKRVPDAGGLAAVEEIRQAAAILLHAAPPLKVWADDMLKTWQKPPRKKGGK